MEPEPTSAFSRSSLTRDCSSQVSGAVLAQGKPGCSTHTASIKVLLNYWHRLADTFHCFQTIVTKLNWLQGASDSAPAIPHLCEFSSTFKPNLRKIPEVYQTPCLNQLLFLYWLIFFFFFLQKSKTEGWQKSSGLGRRKSHLCEDPFSE